MPRPVVQDVQGDFSAGLNVAADESQLKPNELRRTDNCVLTEFGGVTKRLGTQRLHVSRLASASVLGGFGWTQPSGTTQLAVCNTDLFHGTYAIPMVWTTVAGTLSPAAHPSFASFRDGSGLCVYIADGGLLNKWDGTTLTENIASTPAVAQLAVQNQRLFGITGDSETLYWSALNNGDSLGIAGSSGGSAVVRTFGLSTLTGLLALGQSLLLFHRRGISRFTGWTQDDIDISTGTRGLSADVGTTAPRSIVAVENVGFFLSDRGFYAVTESEVRPISPQIEPVIQSLDQSAFARVVGAHHAATREVRWYLPDVGIYSYNYRLNAWTGPLTDIYVDQTTPSMWSTVNATSQPIVLFGGQDGWVRKADVTAVFKDDVLSDSTGGTAFTMSARCRRMFCRTPEAEKAFRWAFFTGNLRGSSGATMRLATSTGTTVQALADANPTVWLKTLTWNSADTWSSLGSRSQKVQGAGRGHFVDITLEDTSSTSQPVFSRVAVEGRLYGR